ncbi:MULTISPECIES: ABC-type transport auxiliary lipoprotein family protein [unclassified Sphingomonas]|uniref:ABC-type transport auxiliary lipoprotein family protein n=1 Tax=unclassified Sphingomonas TaxID=196159 RepID=UPI000830BFE7|nr:MULTISPECIES: ABC-type transport auxiliary lipoprotein family protein [unclassified Sphingomonas]
MKKLVLIALIPLAACVRFGAEPPPALMTLTPAAAVPVGREQKSADARTVTLTVPVVPQELAVTRVPVRSAGTRVTYVKDAQWVEPPARMFARLLADTITAQTPLVVLGARQFQVDPGAMLSGELRSFTIDADTQEAVVVYDAALIREGVAGVEKRRFEAREPVTAVEADAVGTALNTAANRVASDVATWLSR